MEAMAMMVMTAMILEALIQVIKTWVPESMTPPNWCWPVVGAVLSVSLCLLAEVDMLWAAGLSLPWRIGEVLTGVLVSRGASFVHDLWDRLRGNTDTGNDIAEMSTHVVYRDGSSEEFKTE